MASGGAKLWFYFQGILRTDPILVVLCLSSLPGLAIAWRRMAQAQARLLTAWVLIACVCLAAFSNRATYYVLPLLPALALIGAQFSPLLRGRTALITCAVLVAAFGAKVWAADALWGLDFRQGTTLRSAAALDRYSRLRRSNELIIVSPDDQYYSSALDLPGVRYVLVVPGPIDYSKTARFFYRLGIILPQREFCALPAALPVYAQRLAAWRVPDASSVATVILARSASEAVDIIRCSPNRDFFLPEEFRKLAVEAAGPTHTAAAVQAGRFFLLSRTSARRPEGSVAPGALVPAH
jgi:hypothetical protein